MIQITPQMRILLATEPVDFRRGSGAMFVFRNRRGTAIKILVYDSQGFWLAQKRLSQGRFHWWPQSAAETAQSLEAHQLQLLLWNGNPSTAQAQPAWRRVSPQS